MNASDYDKFRRSPTCSDNDLMQLTLKQMQDIADEKVFVRSRPLEDKYERSRQRYYEEKARKSEILE